MSDSYFPMLQEDLDNLCEYEHGDLQRIVKSFHAEIERLRAEVIELRRHPPLVVHPAVTTAAAFEEAAKIAEGFVDKEIDPVYHSSPLNEYRTVQPLQVAAAIRAKAKRSEVRGE